MKRGVLIGAGGFGGVWARTLLPAFSDRVRIVAIADRAAAALEQSGDALGLPADARFTSAEAMLQAVDADICFIVIQPGARTDLIRHAASRGMDILCEKPLGATWDQSLEIASIARSTGIRLAVIQNYRDAGRILALKSVLQRHDLGSVNLLQCRMAVDYTIDTAGGAFRHQHPDAFIFEGAVHHLDQFRNLLSCDASWVQGHQWNQPWSTFGNNPCLLLAVGMESGAIVQYELNHIDRGHQNGWHQEYYRAACEGGTVTLDADNLIRITRHRPGDKETTETVSPVIAPHDGHLAQIARFLAWVDGGPPPDTIPADNLRTMALTFAAIEATHIGKRIDVADFQIPANLLDA